MDEYIKILCDEKHKEIEKRFDEGMKNMDKIENKIDNVRTLTITVLVTLLACLLSLVGTLLAKSL